jgi:hypothetical protein
LRGRCEGFNGNVARVRRREVPMSRTNAGSGRGKGSNASERLVLEIRGRQGRIYLKGMSFGSLKHLGLGIEGHAAAFVRTPVNLFPESHGVIWEPLHREIQQVHRHVLEARSPSAGSNLYETGFSECTIRVETQVNGRSVTRPKYRFSRVQVLDIYRFPKQGAVNDYYEFDFGDYQTF